MATATAEKFYIPDNTDFDALAYANYEFYVQYIHNGKYTHGKHTRFLCKKLQEIERKHAAGEPTHTIITMPPRHSKSMTVTETFPSWFIGRDKNRQVIEVSYGATLARKFGLANLQKIEGGAGRIFNMQLDPRQAAANNFKIDGHDGQMISTGIGGAITGEGADLLIIDDPIRNRQDANSPAYRDKVWNEWQATLQTRLQPGASVIIILTRWHESDLAGKLLEEEGDTWDLIKMPAIAIEDEPDLLGRKPGQALWAERGLNEEWAARKEISVGPLDWAALYQQDPQPAKGTLLKRQYWKYYTQMPDRRTMDRIILSWDCTFKDLETSDYVVGQVWGKRGPDFFLLDQVREKMGLIATMDAINQQKAVWKEALGIYIEDKANGTPIIEMLKQKIPGINPVEPHGGKVVRAQAVLPFIAAGNVWLPDAQLAPWINDVVKEASSFPFGKHDDTVDAMTQALKILSDDDMPFIGRA